MIYSVRNICFQYPGSNKRILKNASLELNKGEILSVLGPNGAGKTTLLNCMAGLFVPQSGEIFLEGRNMKDMKPSETASIVGYVPQIHVPAFNYTVLDFIMMGRAPKLSVLQRPSDEDMQICYDVMDEMGITKLAGKSYMEISGGERQQTLIARAIVQNPEVILFDEPTAHLDYGNQQKVLSLILKMAERGFAVVITTHNPDHALLLGNRTAIVSRKGNILSGQTEEIITEENLMEIYSMPARLIYIPELGRTACVTPKL